jgi:hypothetical protein
MKSYVFALAGLAAIGFAGAAYAGDWSTATTTATAPKALNDGEMDKVTAGVSFDVFNKNGQVEQSKVNDRALSTGNGLRGTGNNAACAAGTGGTCFRTRRRSSGPAAGLSFCS